MVAERAHAHDAAPVTRNADAPAASVARTGWERTISQRSAHHSGARPFRLYDDLLKGKSVAINVIYTSCKDECPLETARLCSCSSFG